MRYVTKIPGILVILILIFSAFHKADCATTLEQVQDSAGIVINEFLVINANNITDDYGEYDPWIEIFNTGTDTFYLGGVYVTDEMQNLTKWRIPDTTAAETLVEPGGYRLLWADGDSAQGIFHLGFEPDANGDTLALVMRDGMTVLDSIIFGAQNANISYGRAVDGGDRWRSFADPSPGAANDTETALLPPTNLYAYPTREGARLSWDFWRPDTMLSFNSGFPMGVWALPQKWGMGVIFDLSPYPGATLEQIDFFHFGHELNSGISYFVVHIYDMENGVELAQTDTLVADDAFNFPNQEIGVALPDIELKADTVGIFVEPLTKLPESHIAFPSLLTDSFALVPNTSYITLDFDNFFETSNDEYVNLYEISMVSQEATNILLDLWINRPEGEPFRISGIGKTGYPYGNKEPLRGVDFFEQTFESFKPVLQEEIRKSYENVSEFKLYRGPHSGDLQQFMTLDRSERAYLDAFAPEGSGFVYAISTVFDSLESKRTLFRYFHPENMRIVRARTDANQDFIPDRLDSIIAVQGVVNSINFAGEPGSLFHLQDSTAGIGLMSDKTLTLSMNDEIYLAGKLIQYDGADYIMPLDSNYVQILGSGVPFDTAAAGLAELDLSESGESKLVTLRNVFLAASQQWPVEGDSGMVRITDGTDTVMLFIDPATSFDGNAPDRDQFGYIQGIITQITKNIPPDDGYVVKLQDYVTHVAVNAGNIPGTIQLSQNFPNPFNPVTQFDVALPHRSDVHITVYNILGQKVASLFRGRLMAGLHTFSFDGAAFPSGIYYYRVRAEGFDRMKKMILIK